jgi:formamidopyrimidine-DNA glycosylase
MGGVWLHSPGERNDPTAGLGPDPLKISVADFAALLSRRRQIKALLLDQTVLAGMGNIYCDEALFAARIHPRAIASALSRPRRHKLWLAMRDRLAEAIRRGGSSIRDYRDANGQLGWFQLTLAAYGRTGEPCPVCATPIAHCTAAGRSTHFCPRCQRR